jgi:hypothetical protein
LVDRFPTVRRLSGATILTNTVALTPPRPLRPLAPLATGRISAAVATNLGVLKELIERA